MLCTQWWLCWIIYLNSIRLYVIRSPQQHTTVRPVATSPSTSHWLWLVEKSIFGKSANRNPSHFLSKTELSSYIRGAIPHTTYGFDTTTCVVQMNTQNDAVSVSFFLYFTYVHFALFAARTGWTALQSGSTRVKACRSVPFLGLNDVLVNFVVKAKQNWN